MGVDEDGRAIVVGYYPDKQSINTASTIGVITSTNRGSFSTPKIISRPPRSFFRGERHGILGLPVVGVGPLGDVFIAYETDWDEQRGNVEFKGMDMLIHRPSKGGFSLPRPFANRFLDLPIGPATYPLSDEAPEPPSITVDGAGRAAVVSSLHTTVEEIFFRSNGRPSHRVRLGSAPYGEEISIAGNADGRTIVTWVNDQNTLTTVVGDTSGHHGPPSHISVPRKTHFRRRPGFSGR